MGNLVRRNSDIKNWFLGQYNLANYSYKKKDSLPVLPWMPCAQSGRLLYSEKLSYRLYACLLVRLTITYIRS